MPESINETETNYLTNPIATFDVAGKTALYLLSSASDLRTGQVVYVDGGYTAG